jgi:hypothetical protein
VSEARDTFGTEAGLHIIDALSLVLALAWGWAFIKTTDEEGTLTITVTGTGTEHEQDELIPLFGGESLKRGFEDLRLV